MSRAAFIVALMLLASCGVDGDPVPPAGSVPPIASEGVELTPEKGTI